ncbi:MAG: hypothetical protein KAU48_03150 [Candidatus Thorarchaeota archaeon]|nr:hypothetical protein [Candidatus Thorarchaeota archaeon]
MTIMLIIFGLILTMYPSSVLVSTSVVDAQETTTWIAMEQNYTDALFRDVTFLNATHGWVVGQWEEGSSGDGIILHTADAGKTWQTQLKNGSEQMYHRLDVVSEDSIWVTGFKALYHSTDGGLTWEEHLVVDTRLLLSFINFIDDAHGWTATNNTLYKTIDGGAHWKIVLGWIFNDTPRYMHFLSPTEVWSIGFYGIYHSIDGAETWTQEYDYGGRSLSMQDDGEGWAVGDGYLIHSSDGTDWTQLPIPGRAPFRGFTLPYFTDIVFIEDNGWIAAGEIPIMHTPDGGSTWYAQNVPSHINRRMMALDFLNSTYGWAVGADGAILKTTRGTDLGSRLWNGMTDPLFLTIVGGLVSVVVVVTGGIFYRRRKRGRIETDMIQ